MCLTISSDGVLLHKSVIGPDNTEYLILLTSYGVGKCGIPPLHCSHRMVSKMPKDVSASMLPPPKPYRDFLLCMEMEGL